MSFMGSERHACHTLLVSKQIISIEVHQFFGSTFSDQKNEKEENLVQLNSDQSKDLTISLGHSLYQQRKAHMWSHNLDKLLSLQPLMINLSLKPRQFWY